MRNPAYIFQLKANIDKKKKHLHPWLSDKLSDMSGR